MQLPTAFPGWERNSSPVLRKWSLLPPTIGRFPPCSLPLCHKPLFLPSGHLLLIYPSSFFPSSSSKDQHPTQLYSRTCCSWIRHSARFLQLATERTCAKCQESPFCVKHRLVQNVWSRIVDDKKVGEEPVCSRGNMLAYGGEKGGGNG